MNRFLDGSQELVVVDNASSERPRAEAEAWKGPGRLIELESNVGFGAASNVGVAEAAGEATVLLNPDTELLDDGLDRLAAESLELGALVGPRVLNPDQSIQPSASGPEVGGWPWVRALVPAAVAPAWVQARTEPYRLERPLEVSWLTGCLRRRPDGAAAPARAVRPGAAPVRRGRRPRAARGRCRSALALRPGRLPDRPPRPGLLDARLRLPRGLARHRDAQLARRRQAGLRPPARVARLARAAAQPAPAPAGQAGAPPRHGARPGGGRSRSSRHAR